MGFPSNAVWMPVFSSVPGLLTGDLLDPLYRGSFADGYVQNEDGALNDADHPAAAGSTITLFATGMGATNPPIVPGSIATSLNVTPIVPVYSSWKTFSFNPPASAETVYSMPGFVSAMFQIPIRVPASLQLLGGVDVGNGVQRVPVGLLFSIRASGGSMLASNLIGVYLK